MREGRRAQARLKGAENRRRPGARRTGRGLRGGLDGDLHFALGRRDEKAGEVLGEVEPARGCAFGEKRERIRDECPFAGEHPEGVGGVPGFSEIGRIEREKAFERFFRLPEILRGHEVGRLGAQREKGFQVLGRGKERVLFVEAARIR